MHLNQQEMLFKFCVFYQQRAKVIKFRCDLSHFSGEYFQFSVYIGAIILFNLVLSGLQISFPD